MARPTGAASKALSPSRSTAKINLPLRDTQECPVSLLRLDLENPRLQTGADFDISTEEELVEVLANIAALDELVLSICTNTYLNLEPLIVCGPDGGPYTVLEGNRRIAAIRLIKDPVFAAKLGIKVPSPVSQSVLDSIEHVLVYRVTGHGDAREFIGFKHINGPQRWDAYAKAKYVTEWYRKADRKVTIDEIAAKMGDSNNTLRAYIYAILILEQAEEADVWSLKDRPPARGRFGFSHLYTALLRTEYQEFLGLSGGWSNLPPFKPIKRQYLQNLGEVLTYIYGSKSDDRPPLIQSQNPDLKNLGLAIENPRSRIALQNRATLEVALDEIKEPASAFHDALVTARLRLDRALGLMSKYSGGVSAIDDLIDEIFAQADTLKTMIDKRRARGKK
jgi:hypothetical protein